jgi:hypothetical protein
MALPQLAQVESFAPALPAAASNWLATSAPATRLPVASSSPLTPRLLS